MQNMEAVLLDPQLDANVLIGLLNGIPEFVDYAQMNQPKGLTYNLATRAEFVAGDAGTDAHLQLLEQRFGVNLIQNITKQDLDDVASRLQAAFQGDPQKRSLGEADARVAASAFLRTEALATADLKFFKRLRDLGLIADFIGTGRALARAAAYQPRPVTIP